MIQINNIISILLGIIFGILISFKITPHGPNSKYFINKSVLPNTDKYKWGVKII